MRCRGRKDTPAPRWNSDGYENNLEEEAAAQIVQSVGTDLHFHSMNNMGGKRSYSEMS